MNYQQPLLVNTRSARSSWRQYVWSDPRQIAANSEGIVTPEQRNMLNRGPGCLYNLVFLLFIFGMLTTALLIGVVIYLFFAGKFIQAPPYIGLELVIFPLLTFVLRKVSSGLRKAHDARFARKVDALTVGSVQGEVIWENSRYIARVPGFQLTKAARSPELPPPGPYHFYYVTEQNILLSAQPIHNFTGVLAQPGTLAETGLSGDEQARLAIQMALCNTLGFSLNDLDANRLGMLSDAQRRKLSTRVFGSIIGAVIGLLFSGSMIFPGIYAITHGVITFGPGANVFFTVLVLGLFGLAFLTMFFASLRHLIFGAWRRYAALDSEAVQSVESYIKTRVVNRDSDTSDSFYYDIGQLSFEVSGAAYNALIGSVRYRVYYMASLKALVSVEPLEAPVR